MIYFHQNGCPYCAKLVDDNFHNEALVKKLKKDFDVIETNMWGDRELTDWTGAELSEKEFSAKMKVQFTPTIIFLNSTGETLLRVNGYQSPEKLDKMLDYISTLEYKNQNFSKFIKSQHKASTLKPRWLFPEDQHKDLKKLNDSTDKYLAVFFERSSCKDCDTFYSNLKAEKSVLDNLEKLKLTRVNSQSEDMITTPSGDKLSPKDWHEKLNLTDSTSIVIFSKSGTEIIRKDAFLKAFHTNGILTYATSHKWKEQPSFQRYLEDKADHIRDGGVTVDLWK